MVTNPNPAYSKNIEEVSNSFYTRGLGRERQDIWADDKLHELYSLVPIFERKCLISLAEEWQHSKPLKNKKVLINCHLTTSTTIMLDLLLLAGAKVFVTVAPDLTLHQPVLDVLKRSRAHFLAYSELSTYANKYFDILIDCGAGLLHKVIPKQGTVELTHTASEIYNHITYPILTVDSTVTKKIETLYGTGDGFIRAINKYFSYTARFSDACLSKGPFIDKKYVIFGYGKVGRGIVSALLEMNTKRENIIIIEIKLNTCRQLQYRNYTAIPLTEANLSIIKQHIKEAFCVVTATGCAGSMSQYFEHDDFPTHVILANMGTPDEWGIKFNASEILNGKKPVNFALENPTQIRYLAPSFRALLLGTVIISNQKLSAGLHDFPEETDQLIYNEWLEYYNPEYREWSN